MKIPLVPPELSKAISTWIHDDLAKNVLLLLDPGIGATDKNGRYLHWDKLRHLPPPEGYTSELYWFAVKQARAKASKQLPFSDMDGTSFSYCFADTVMRDVLWISQNASGSMISEASMPDGRASQTYLINSLIEEAISSSQLEGASTTRRVAKEMIRSGRKPKNHSEKMILNNHFAMSFVREYKTEPLTPSIIFELHKILTEGTLAPEDEGKAGCLRDVDDDICVYSKEGDKVLHVPPKAGDLPRRLQLICDFANETDGNEDICFIPPVIRAILVHFMIGYHHPFVDGNGRTARALFYWVMAKSGHWLMEHISISRVIKQAPVKYMYAYLYAETDQNDTTYFIVHQLEVIKQAISDFKDYLIEKAEERKDAEKALDKSPLKGGLNFRQLNLIKNALKNPGAEYTIRSHQVSHGVTYQTARTDLLTLSDKFEVLKKYKVGRKDVFVAPPDLREQLKSWTSS